MSFSKNFNADLDLKMNIKIQDNQIDLSLMQNGETYDNHYIG